MHVRDKDIQLIRLYAKKTQDVQEWQTFFDTVKVEDNRLHSITC